VLPHTLLATLVVGNFVVDPNSWSLGSRRRVVAPRLLPLFRRRRFAVLMRGIFDRSLREPSTAFFSCAFSCSSLASRLARSATISCSTQSWSTFGTTIDQV